MRRNSTPYLQSLYFSMGLESAEIATLGSVPAYFLEGVVR